jgi:hypothetical protein
MYASIDEDTEERDNENSDKGISFQISIPRRIKYPTDIKALLFTKQVNNNISDN